LRERAQVHRDHGKGREAGLDAGSALGTVKPGGREYCFPVAYYIVGN